MKCHAGREPKASMIRHPAVKPHPLSYEMLSTAFHSRVLFNLNGIPDRLASLRYSKMVRDDNFIESESPLSIHHSSFIIRNSTFIILST